RPDATVHRICVRGDAEEVVQRAGLVAFKVRPGDVAEGRGVHDPPDGVECLGEHATETGMEEERMLIADEELTHPDLELLVEGRDPKDPLADFLYFGHGCL